MASILKPSVIVGGTSCDNTDNEDPNTAAGGEGKFRVRSASSKGQNPALFHKLKDERSILALLISNGKIYAGTQSGDLLV